MNGTLGRSRESGKIGAGCIITIVVVIVALGVGAFFLFKAGLGIVEEQVKTSIRDNPVILEHVGNITEIKMDMKASAAAGGDDQFVFRLVGSKGKGELTAVVETVGDAQQVTQGSLRTEDGKTYDLFAGAAGGGEAGGG